MVQTIPRTACQPCGEFFAASPVSDFGRCLISAGAVAGRVCADRVFVGRQLLLGGLLPDRCLLSGGSAGGILRNNGSRPEPPSVPKRIPAGIGLRGFFI